jgi:hypothetical protein
MSYTVHLGKRAFSVGMALHYCNGRAVSNLLSITEAPERVTCKRCLKKLAAQGLPSTAAEG